MGKVCICSGTLFKIGMETISFAQILAEPSSFKLNGYCYGAPGGKQGTVGKEKGIHAAYVPAWGKMRCHPFKACYLKHNSWINPVK